MKTGGSAQSGLQIGNRQGPPQARAPQDVIDRGLLPLHAAFAAFDHFTSNMIPLFPIVVFPKGTTAAQMRSRCPIIFLAAINAASGLLSLELQRELNRELMRVFADRILVVGEKSLELVQAVQIATIWYYPPGRYEELKYYQFVRTFCV